MPAQELSLGITLAELYGEPPAPGHQHTPRPVRNVQDLMTPLPLFNGVPKSGGFMRNVPEYQGEFPVLHEVARTSDAVLTIVTPDLHPDLCVGGRVAVTTRRTRARDGEVVAALLDGEPVCGRFIARRAGARFWCNGRIITLAGHRFVVLAVFTALVYRDLGSWYEVSPF